MMKILLNVIAVLLILGGGTFFLQGINVLPGSYMTGDLRWVFIGGVMVVIGLGFLVWANRRR
jgi:cytochrome c biogenesis factor